MGLVLLQLHASNRLLAVDDVAGQLFVLNDNGGWSWFENERAIIDADYQVIVTSSVANSKGAEGNKRAGDVDVNAYSWKDRQSRRYTLAANLQQDDHDSAALWLRPDGRYLAMYAKHGADSMSRYRISTRPHDIDDWSPERLFNNGAPTTYSNLHYMPHEAGKSGRLYNFNRAANFNPNFIISDDWGETWKHGGRLLSIGAGNVRPYVHYVSNGTRIHVLATEHHPLSFDTSVYHGYVERGQLFNSHGVVVDENIFDEKAVPPDRLTCVFKAGTSVEDMPMHRAWLADLELDKDGNPYAVLSARANDNPQDHRFLYAYSNGAAWQTTQLARAGGFLYQGELDYTGLAALVPKDPARVYVSTNVNPTDGKAMTHYEIFLGTRADNAGRWSWQAITYESTCDNIRPVIPKGDRVALIWLRGKYDSYISYDLNVVGLLSIGKR